MGSTLETKIGVQSRFIVTETFGPFQWTELENMSVLCVCVGGNIDMHRSIGLHF